MIMADDDELTKLAIEELTKNAKRGKERSETLGATGWKNTPVPGVHKIFMRNTILNNVKSNARLKKQYTNKIYPEKSWKQVDTKNSTSSKLFSSALKGINTSYSSEDSFNNRIETVIGNRSGVRRAHSPDEAPDIDFSRLSSRRSYKTDDTWRKHDTEESNFHQSKKMRRDKHHDGV